MIGWQVQYHAQWAVLFLAAHILAGIANFNKPPSVYPVFGPFRGTNPPLLRSLIPVLTLTRLSEWKRENNGSFLCTVAPAWQKKNSIINGKTCHRRSARASAQQLSIMRTFSLFAHTWKTARGVASTSGAYRRDWSLRMRSDNAKCVRVGLKIVNS